MERACAEGTTLLASLFLARIDDRFIFKTDSTKLWFDRNDQAKGGLVHVADPQAGPVVTLMDILLV